MDAPTLGTNIRELRKKAGYRTQGALAKALGVPQPQVSDWENDRYDILDTKTLMRLGKQLQVSIDEILRGTDPEYDAMLGTDVALPTPEHDQAAARLNELEGRIEAYKTLIEQLSALNEQAILLASDSGEGRAPVRTQQRLRGRDRRRDRQNPSET